MTKIKKLLSMLSATVLLFSSIMFNISFASPILGGQWAWWQVFADNIDWSAGIVTFRWTKMLWAQDYCVWMWYNGEIPSATKCQLLWTNKTSLAKPISSVLGKYLFIWWVKKINGKNTVMWFLPLVWDKVSLYRSAGSYYILRDDLDYDGDHIKEWCNEDLWLNKNYCILFVVSKSLYIAPAASQKTWRAHYSNSNCWSPTNPTWNTTEHCGYCKNLNVAWLQWYVPGVNTELATMSQNKSKLTGVYNSRYWSAERNGRPRVWCWYYGWRKVCYSKKVRNISNSAVSRSRPRGNHYIRCVAK